MSYVLHVWEKPVPATAEEAAAIHEKLLKERPGQNPKFIEFARRVMERHPCGEEDEDGEDIWTELPFDGVTDDAVLSFLILSQFLEEIYPTVVEVANELGLLVYDMQSGDVFLANGKRLQFGNAQQDGAQASETDGRAAEMDLLIHQRLIGFMARYGYEPIPNTRDFMKKFDGGWHSISPFVYETEPHYAISFAARHDHFAVSRLYDEIAHPEIEWTETYEYPLVILYPERWTVEKGHRYNKPNGDFIVPDVSELDAALAFMQEQIVRHLFPILDQCETISGFDRLVNPPTLTDSVFFVGELFHGFDRGYRNVLAAYLARNPRLEEICKTIETALKGKRGATSLENSLKCIEYVRSR